MNEKSKEIYKTVQARSESSEKRKNNNSKNKMRFVLKDIANEVKSMR